MKGEGKMRSLNVTTYHSRIYRLICFAFFSVFVFLIPLSYFLSPNLQAAEKTWNAKQDETDWSDDTNWFPQAAPGGSDDATVNADNATTNISSTYNLKSLTIGGTQTSAVVTNDFVSGVVAPEHKTDVAILNRRGGLLKLKGPGTTRIRGTYKDSEESLADQPSLVFYVK